MPCADISTDCLCVAQLPRLLAAGIHLVMAQQTIVNVESQVGQSVVESTTDVDASKTLSSTTSGGIFEENRTESTAQDLGTTKTGGEEGGNGATATSNFNVIYTSLRGLDCWQYAHGRLRE